MTFTKRYGDEPFDKQVLSIIFSLNQTILNFILLVLLCAAIFIYSEYKTGLWLAVQMNCFLQLMTIQYLFSLSVRSCFVIPWKQSLDRLFMGNIRDSRSPKPAWTCLLPQTALITCTEWQELTLSLRHQYGKKISLFCNGSVCWPSWKYKPLYLPHQQKWHMSAIHAAFGGLTVDFRTL